MRTAGCEVFDGIPHVCLLLAVIFPTRNLILIPNKKQKCSPNRVERVGLRDWIEAFLKRGGTRSCLCVVVVPVALKTLHKEEKFHGPRVCRQGSRGIKRENDLPKACMETHVERRVLAVASNLQEAATRVSL